MTWILVAVGGGLGAMARHALNAAVHKDLLGTAFPYGIFLVNIIGSGAIGLLAGLIATSRLPMSIEARTFVFVGVLGGFTTFSSFSLDTLTLMRTGHSLLALWNVAGQVGLSLLAVSAGYRLGSMF